MSGLNRQPSNVRRVEQHTRVEGLVDPTVELSQPGGPFPYGEALLTDGAGSYTIGPTLRPYLLTFRFSNPTGVALTGCGYCDHQGVLTDLLGVPLPFAANIIGIGVSLSHETKKGQGALVEVFRIMEHANVVVAVLSVEQEMRSAFRRDLSVDLPAGAELGVRLRHVAGEQVLPFTKAIVSVELEG